MFAYWLPLVLTEGEVALAARGRKNAAGGPVGDHVSCFIKSKHKKQANKSNIAKKNEVELGCALIRGLRFLRLRTALRARVGRVLVAGATTRALAESGLEVVLLGTLMGRKWRAGEEQNECVSNAAYRNDVTPPDKDNSPQGRPWRGRYEKHGQGRAQPRHRRRRFPRWGRGAGACQTVSRRRGPERKMRRHRGERAPWWSACRRRCRVLRDRIACLVTEHKRMRHIWADGAGRSRGAERVGHE